MQTHTAIIKGALRDAALAPSDNDAFDITGNALRRLANLVGREVGMTDRYAILAKAWQIHDVLQTLSAALPEDRLDDAIPIHGVVGLLLDLSRQVANAISDEPKVPPGVAAREGAVGHAQTLEPLGDTSREIAAVADTLSDVSRLFTAIIELTERGGLTCHLAELGIKKSRQGAESFDTLTALLNESRKRTRPPSQCQPDEGDHMRTDEYSSGSDS
jgi:hypothetical protein